MPAQLFSAACNHSVPVLKFLIVPFSIINEVLTIETKRNYSKELDKIVKRLQDGAAVPKLLLHACCAPCSSYVLEYLSRYFSIYLLYYNPNISPIEEYEKRKAELERLVSSMPVVHPVTLVSCGYEGEAFEETAKGLEGEPEGGSRCRQCYRLRLEAAAKAAQKLSCDFFTTTLSISPLKNAAVLNQIGEEIGALYGIAHLPADFKKKDGYKRSIELSREYGLYRQNYCGCIYSQRESEQARQERMR